jgi:hypothetical protein
MYDVGEDQIWQGRIGCSLFEGTTLECGSRGWGRLWKPSVLLVFGQYQNLFTASAVVLGNITVLLIMHLRNAMYNVKECDDFENR